jgi:hypothetical protein
VAKRRTPEEIADDNERTTTVGLFLTAEAYWRGASVLFIGLKRTKRTLPFAEKPAYFCYYHAIELYLKAFLRHYHSVDELEGKFRHNTTKLMSRAKELGIIFDDEDVEVLGLMGETDAVIRARYVRSGFFRWPTLEALNRTCKSLRISVSEALKKAGVSAPLIRAPRRTGNKAKAKPSRTHSFPNGFEAG